MTILAIAASADQGRHVYGLVAGNYLDKVQCEVTFIADTFEVAVNQVFKNVSVTPSGQTPVPVDIDASGNLADVAFLCPSYLSQVLTTGYTSVLSGAFDTNIDNVRARENHTEGSTTSDVLAGVSEGLESLLDHCLGSLGAAQQIVVDDTQTVKANATINVVKLGEPKVVAGLLGVSVAILILLGLEAIRSKFWRNLTLFNSLDLKSAILGVVVTRSKPELLTTWNGDSSDRKTGSIRVAIAANKRGLEVLLDDTEYIGMPYAPETARISAEPLLEVKPGSAWFKFHST
ncbi:hypothetical protein F4860DRAFT_499253 [Xylaria cubensis]|nr:hypothetical protein F4860DRAFT_499253 [Xylaria cubensis]